jgi:hypothetical protein
MIVHDAHKFRYKAAGALHGLGNALLISGNDLAQKSSEGGTGSISGRCYTAAHCVSHSTRYDPWEVILLPQTTV